MEKTRSPKNVGGRPRKKLTQEQLCQVEALAAFLSKEQIADYFGICKNTFLEIEKRQPELSERYKKGKAKAIVSIANNLIKQAREGNLTAAIFYLKTQAGWKEVQKIDHSSEDGSMIPQIVILPAKEEDDGSG